jgi:endonuclease YncB( thermonuclease family)
MARKQRSPGSLLVPVALVLAGLSLYEFADRGVVTWHRDPAAALETLSLQLRELWRRQQQAAPFVVERSKPSEPAVRVNRELVDSAALNSAYINPGQPRFELVGRVSRVIDGDSVGVQIGGNEFSVRLFGIDTPERDQPHGDAAARALTGKLDSRTVVVVIADIDSYGRLVGTVYYRGHNINLEMIAEGHAWWYRQYAGSAGELEAAEQAAREAGLGLWSGREPVAPWQWRQDH